MKIIYLFTTYPKNILMIWKTTRNWIEVLFYRAKWINIITISFRDGDHIYFDSDKCDWRNILSIIELKYLLKNFNVSAKENDKYTIIVNGEITFIADNISLADTLFLIYEQYYKDDYRINKLSLNNKIVIDIGANIGDTALLFASKGATVFAFEPIHTSFRRLELNISANEIGKNIIPFNVGLSDREKEIEIMLNPNATVGISTFSKINRDNMHREKIQLVNALNYLRDNNITSCDLLKIDCEGCETVLLKDPSLLKYLGPNGIILEYHNNSDRTILPILREYFDNIEIIPSTMFPSEGIILGNM